VRGLAFTLGGGGDAGLQIVFKADGGCGHDTVDWSGAKCSTHVLSISFGSAAPGSVAADRGRGQRRRHQLAGGEVQGIPNARSTHDARASLHRVVHLFARCAHGHTDPSLWHLRIASDIG
jgi:hypothetical protein